jgi:hypothetical protein
VDNMKKNNNGNTRRRLQQLPGPLALPAPNPIQSTTLTTTTTKIPFLTMRRPPIEMLNNITTTTKQTGGVCLSPRRVKDGSSRIGVERQLIFLRSPPQPQPLRPATKRARAPATQHTHESDFHLIGYFNTKIYIA